MHRLVTSWIAVSFVASSIASATTLPQNSLASWYVPYKASIPGPGTNAYVPPSQAEADTFRAAFANLLSGDVSEAASAFDSLGYEIDYLIESPRTYIMVLEHAGSGKNRGAFIVNPRASRDLVLEVPHPLFDTNTGEEGIVLLGSTGARALLIAGSHRCANSALSSCSGTTSACTGGAPQAFHNSDMGHTMPSFFQAAHEAISARGNVAVNLHGNGSEIPDVEISDGTMTARSATSLVIKVRDSLATAGVNVASCNWPADNPSSLGLCGTTNVQGRWTNGSANPCTSSPTNASGQFLHVEQHLPFRNSPGALGSALGRLLPQAAPPPSPSIASLVPSHLPAGSAATMVTLNGANFHRGATVEICRSSNCGSRDATFISGEALTVLLTASELQNEGTLSLAVTNLDTLVSSAAVFTVDAPQAKPVRRRVVRH